MTLQKPKDILEEINNNISEMYMEKCDKCKKKEILTRSSIGNQIWQLKLCINCKDVLVGVVRDFGI